MSHEQPALFDLAIIGAGFAGMYALKRALDSDRTAIVFERGDDVGGTWYWNRYPGARCDVQSMEYSYSFDDDLQQEWRWSERFAPQPEILKYAQHVAERFKLRNHIRFETTVESATYLESEQLWEVKTDTGLTALARTCIMATGCLSSTNLPAFEGIDDFEGEHYHTGLWPHEPVDFSGKRVGIIGTGSSAIQSIPIIAETAGHLTVFQRTANYSIPAHNGPIDESYADMIRKNYADFRDRNRQMFAGFGADQARSDLSVFEVDDAERAARFEIKWQEGGLGFTSTFGDLGRNPEANQLAAEFVRSKIKQTVEDPEVADLLCPDQVIGCKRVCVDTNYYATYNKAHVELVNVRQAPIERLTKTGLIQGGVSYDFDIIIFATGFDAMTGTLLRIDITGKDGLKLKDKWEAGPTTYLGLGIHGFPNLFTVSGPGSPSVLSNMIVTIEQHVNFIFDCLDYLKSNGLSSVEAEADAEAMWVQQGNAIANETLFPTCNSWYLGANVPGKPRIFMPFVGGFPLYQSICKDVQAHDYRGFQLA